MLRFNNTSRIIVTALALMILLSSFQLDVKAQASLDPIVVLYDANHRQQIDPFDEEGLKLMFDMVNESSRYIVGINEDNPLNASVLNDVDILIMSDPDTSSEFTQEESSAIVEMLANGSSLLALGNPTISQNSTYWSSQPFQDLGENIAMNTFFDQINMSGVRFSVNHTTDDRIWGDILFDYEHSLHVNGSWVLQLDSSTWDTTHPIFKDINELFTMTSTLRPIDTASTVARGYDSSFAQFRRGTYSWGNTSFPNMSLTEFEEVPLSYSAINGTLPPWLAAFEYSGSRVIVAGSTMMFTGYNLDLPSADSRSESQWFYQGDNARLFMNMLDWLSAGSAEPPSAIVPILTISAVVLLVGVAYYLIKKMR
ncbi:MAG: hypothetical protein RTU09_03235 [Candidatus Thorarchaeota archaeon]